jgi:prepilin-type N-terminal cleavage/methylation domain-containing protein
LLMPHPLHKISHRRHAFTLIELMVVIGIMVIILAVSIPGLKAMTKGNDTAQATSMVSSLIANARSIAISQGRIAGVAFYEANSGKAGQTQAAYVVQDIVTSVNTNQNLFLMPLAGGTIQQLPRGAKIVGLQTADPINPASGNVGTLNVGSTITAVTTVPARVVLFDEGGQLLVRAKMVLDAPTSTTVQSTKDTLTSWATDWAGFWASTSQAPSNTSTPALVIYSDGEFTSANPSGTSQSVQNQWLLQHAKVLVINAYTGTVIQ